MCTGDTGVGEHLFALLGDRPDPHLDPQVTDEQQLGSVHGESTVLQ
jgi:hypothetical protein